MSQFRKAVSCTLSVSLLAPLIPASAIAKTVGVAIKSAPASLIAPIAPVTGFVGHGPISGSLTIPQLTGSGLDVVEAVTFDRQDTAVAANDNTTVVTPLKQTITVSAHAMGVSPRGVTAPQRIIRRGAKRQRQDRHPTRKVVMESLEAFQDSKRMPAALVGSKLNSFFDWNRPRDKDTPVVAPGASLRTFRHGDLKHPRASEGGVLGSELDQAAKPPAIAEPEFKRPKGLQSNYFFWRTVLSPFANLFFGPRIRGLQNIPKTGPALLLPNHVTWVDVFLLSFAVKRPVRFLMYKDYYEAPSFHWFVKRFSPIVIEPGNPAQVDHALAEARDAIAHGDLVAIFPEGTLTRNGTMRRFKRGMETISADLDAPVIPVHLDGLWSSLLSRRPVNSWGEFFRRIFTRSIIRFGTPLKKSTVAVARDAVEQLSAYSMYERVQMKYRDLGGEFTRSAYRHWFRPAFADSTGVSLSYGKAFTGAWLLSKRFKKIFPKAPTVGLLMPASVGGALANAAVALMGKVSVNLNFTASKDSIRHAVEAAGIKHAVTSRKFLDGFAKKKGWRLEEVLDGVELVILEDVAKTIPSWKKTLTYLGLLVGGPTIRFFSMLSHLVKKAGLDRNATIIFTSGSTAMPKGVALSHTNIISNVEMIREVYPLDKTDVVLGVLPFFHSFGYTVTLWMSVMMGVKTVYHHNPFDADTIGKLAQEHGATTILGTPTFLRRYRKRIPAKYFDKMKLVVAGAEKLWSRDVEAFEEEYGTRPMEGYGATETAPVVSVSIPDWTIAKGARQKYRGYGYRENSVGIPLPGVAVRIIDPETGEFLSADKPGLILVKGPNVMGGYLNDPEKTAEVLKDGWYYTGDIGYRDRDGFLFIVGRASRFAKIAGEMVPLGAIEEKLHKSLGVEDQTFGVFAVPDKKMGERLVVLHTGFDGSPKELLAKIEGLPRLWTPRANMFFKIDEFPVLGTGKADLKALQQLATELGGDSVE